MIWNHLGHLFYECRILDWVSISLYEEWQMSVRCRYYHCSDLGDDPLIEEAEVAEGSTLSPLLVAVLILGQVGGGEQFTIVTIRSAYLSRKSSIDSFSRQALRSNN